MMAQERELRAKLKELRDHIVKNADNVGERFPNEARKMHYGDIEHRPIYGEASPEEARVADRRRRRGLAAAGAAGRPELTPSVRIASLRASEATSNPDVPR